MASESSSCHNFIKFKVQQLLLHEVLLCITVTDSILKKKEHSKAKIVLCWNNSILS